MTTNVPKSVLDSFRKHREKIDTDQSLYPFAMGRVEMSLTAPGLKPSQRVAEALLQIAALDIIQAEPDPMPDGLIRSGGKLMFRCRSCEQWAELDGEPSDFNQNTAYCGGSPRCTP